MIRLEIITVQELSELLREISLQGGVCKCKKRNTPEKEKNRVPYVLINLGS